jgi:hypothetical protein
MNHLGELSPHVKSIGSEEHGFRHWNLSHLHFIPLRPQQLPQMVLQVPKIILHEKLKSNGLTISNETDILERFFRDCEHDVGEMAVI